MLIIFWINNKQQPLWLWILWLWALLFILALIISFSDKWEARTLAWICIWISTLFDGMSLLIIALKIKNIGSSQAKLLDNLNQNEIGKWDIIITQTTVVTKANTDSETQQPNSENS